MPARPACRAASVAVAPGATAGAGLTPALDQYTVDLTAQARAGTIDPIRGRDAEIRQIVDILLRRRQNNPILTGEAGVGKTAVVEGFAQRIAQGLVPPSLANAVVRSLDLALLQAGAGIKGEFENRLKSVIAEVRASSTPIILFIDEAHQLIGAGGMEGQGDAANLLKPALARGELRTIAATTWAEYKKYVERDPALARRFQVVKVEEPEPDAAVGMLRGMVATLEQHHGVEILDEAVTDAVRLSHRYISGRQLPDKAISVLDTACARVAVGQAGAPPQLEALEHDIVLAVEALQIARRQHARGEERGEAIAKLDLQAGRLAQAPGQPDAPSWPKSAARLTRSWRCAAPSPPIARRPTAWPTRKSAVRAARNCSACKKAWKRSRKTSRWCRCASIRASSPTSFQAGPASRSAR